jgi:hypothetical protein
MFSDSISTSILLVASDLVAKSQQLMFRAEL